MSDSRALVERFTCVTLLRLRFADSQSMSSASSIQSLDQEVPEPLQAWATVVMKLAKSKTQMQTDTLVLNYEKCAKLKLQGPGGTWTMDVLDAILDCVRGQTQWSIRPREEDVPVPKVTKAMDVPDDAALPITWAWLLVPVPWLDESQANREEFPLPVACLGTPLAGHEFLLSLSALWHLLPMKESASSFFVHGSSCWCFARQLGVDRSDHVVPSNKSKSLTNTPRIEDERLASKLSFPSYMGSPKVLLCAIAWMASHGSQAKPMQKST